MYCEFQKENRVLENSIQVDFKGNVGTSDRDVRLNSELDSVHFVTIAVAHMYKFT